MAIKKYFGNAQETHCYLQQGTSEPVRTERIYGLIWLTESFLCLENKDNTLCQSIAKIRERASRCCYLEGPTPGFEIPCPQPPLLHCLVAATATSSNSHWQLHSPRKGPKLEIPDCLPPQPHRLV